MAGELTARRDGVLAAIAETSQRMEDSLGDLEDAEESWPSTEPSSSKGSWRRSPSFSPWSREDPSQADSLRRPLLRKAEAERPERPARDSLRSPLQGRTRRSLRPKAQ